VILFSIAASFGHSTTATVISYGSLSSTQINPRG
jgi:hypothetical protein